MLNPFIDLIVNIINLYIFVIFAWAILSMLISFKVVNGHQPAVRKIMYALDRLAEPALRPIRKVLPDLGGIDVAPIILLLVLNFIVSALHTYLYNIH